jgi:hypothetical protein
VLKTNGVEFEAATATAGGGGVTKIRVGSTGRAGEVEAIFPFGVIFLLQEYSLIWSSLRDRNFSIVMMTILIGLPTKTDPKTSMSLAATS